MHGTTDPYTLQDRYPVKKELMDVTCEDGEIVHNMLSPIPHTAEVVPRSYVIDHGAQGGSWIHPDEASFFQKLQEEAESRGQTYQLPDYECVDATYGIVTRLGSKHWSKWTLGDRVFSTKGPFVPATEAGVPWFVDVGTDGGLGMWRPPIEPIIRTASRAVPPPTFSSIKQEASSVTTATQAQSEVPPPPPPPPADPESNAGFIKIHGTDYPIYRIGGTQWGLSGVSRVPFDLGILTPPDSDAESEAGEGRTATFSKDNTRNSRLRKTAEQNQRSLDALNEQVTRLSKPVWTRTSRQGTEGKMWRDTGVKLPAYISVGA